MPKSWEDSYTKINEEIRKEQQNEQKISELVGKFNKKGYRVGIMTTRDEQTKRIALIVFVKNS